MALRLMPKSKVWAYQCKINGKTWIRSTGQTDRKKAEKEIPRLRKLAQLLRERPNASPKLSKAIVEEVARIETDVSSSAAERVSYALRNFLEYAGDIFLERVTAQLVENYQRKRLQEAARATIEKEVGFLLRMLRQNGFSILKPSPKKGKVTEQRAFTPHEVQRFFAACPDRLKCLYALMLATGARLAEMVPSPRSSHVALLKSEVDLAALRVTIRSAKNRSGTVGKVRVLPLPAELVPLLERQMACVAGPHVFKPLPDSPRDFDLILKRAGIPKVNDLGQKVTAHCFRHTYATMMAEAIGQNPFVLKEILGHKRLSTTERYCHLTAPSLPLSWKEITPLGPERGVGSGCRILDIASETGT